MDAEVRYRHVLRSVLLGRHDEAEQLKVRIRDEEYQNSGELISAVFCIAVESRFKGDSSPAAIRAFMDEARQNFADAQPPLKPVAAEALIRSVFGEDHLLDEVDSDDFVPTQLPLARKIFAESADLRESIDEILNEAEHVIADWAASED